MDFQRIYVDSRDREFGGTASELDYMLANNIVVDRESVAVLDCVLLPNSWYTIEKIETTHCSCERQRQATYTIT